MSAVELIVQLTQALAWPFFSLIIVLVLGKPLRQVLMQRMAAANAPQGGGTRKAPPAPAPARTW